MSKSIKANSPAGTEEFKDIGQSSANDPILPQNHIDIQVILAERRKQGIDERKRKPSLSYCQRCGRPWSICRTHITNYTKSHGCFPLCCDCWRELTPQERIPYYRCLWLDWQISINDDGIHWDEIWNNIENAVLAGG